MPERWVSIARKKLLAAREAQGGWSYRAGTSPASEPTALSCLALLGTDESGSAPGEGGLREELRAAGQWLTTCQQADGSVSVRPGQPVPGWPTSHAILAWHALGGSEPARDRALKWLLLQKGLAIPRTPENPQDTMIEGWPWITSTHSWLEPTACAVLALRREGQLDHVRTVDGLRLIRDRAILTSTGTGGWNYGNKGMLGTVLRPQPAPTGLALLALAGLDRSDSPIVTQACDYLLKILPETRAPMSLGWGLLGLRAWGVWPREATAWLDAAARPVLEQPRQDTPIRLAHLLLPAGDQILSVLGLPTPAKNAANAKEASSS